MRQSLEQSRVPLQSVHVIRSWHDHPGFVDFLAGRLEAALGRAGRDPIVVFTAHSVPRAAIEGGDPYPEQLRETGALVAARAGVTRWELAFQSAGRTSDPWIGPDILDVIDRLADAGETSVVVQAIGFVADHLEILYDLDIEARRAAESRGLPFTRVEMPNRAPGFVDALADIVLEARRL